MTAAPVQGRRASHTAGATPPSCSTGPQDTRLHQITRVLQSATAAENTATGAALREAFRTTRYLLGGARAIGFTVPELSALLGVSSGALRARSDQDGSIPTTTFIALAGIAVTAIEMWQHAGTLGTPSLDESGRESYPASALLRALLTMPPTEGRNSISVAS
ncbi:hypothetical protein HUN58_02080 [Curtobacterium sp. Csp1]|uniref:hypothetical protein n=1 Tax=Curtobacterium sp. Csp1 TaxID=2495429 RepID=UPI001599051C|nr:hypothetical protein [Curtobacterium sp. Csp1]QKS18849.1 hypothetical protein HUN58_02080 [Curtobacterium sp. Csp1]